MSEIKKTLGIFDRAYEIVALIPPGKVMSYGQVAALIGNPRLARRVGQAMYGAPAGRDLPCHRVVKKQGELCGNEEFGEKQRSLLILEGVPFLEDGRVDMEHAVYWPDILVL